MFHSHGADFFWLSLAPAWHYKAASEARGWFYFSLQRLKAAAFPCPAVLGWGLRGSSAMAGPSCGSQVCPDERVPGRGRGAVGSLGQQRGAAAHRQGSADKGRPSDVESPPRQDGGGHSSARGASSTSTLRYVLFNSLLFEGPAPQAPSAGVILTARVKNDRWSDWLFWFKATFCKGVRGGRHGHLRGLCGHRYWKEGPLILGKCWWSRGSRGQITEVLGAAYRGKRGLCDVTGWLLGWSISSSSSARQRAGGKPLECGCKYHPAMAAGLCFHRWV